MQAALLPVDIAETHAQFKTGVAQIVSRFKMPFRQSRILFREQHAEIDKGTRVLWIDVQDILIDFFCGSALTKMGHRNAQIEQEIFNLCGIVLQRQLDSTNVIWRSAVEVALHLKKRAAIIK